MSKYEHQLLQSWKKLQSEKKVQLSGPPPPKKLERNILGYVDCLKFCYLFLLIAQFNNNKRLPHNTSTTHNNNQNEPTLPYPRRLSPLIPWTCQRRPQHMAPWLPMAPHKVPVIGFGRVMVGSLVGGAKWRHSKKLRGNGGFALGGQNFMGRHNNQPRVGVHNEGCW